MKPEDIHRLKEIICPEEAGDESLYIVIIALNKQIIELQEKVQAIEDERDARDRRECEVYDKYIEKNEKRIKELNGDELDWDDE